MTKRLFWLALLVIALGAGGYWYTTRAGGAETKAARAAKADAPKTRPAVPVVMQPVAMAAVPERLETIGTVQPLAAIAIKARVDTVVDSVHFSEGQEVKAGDLLFTLDSRALEAQLAQAQANLERDRANLENAKNDVKRYAELVRTNTVARQQYDTAVATANALTGTVKADQAAIDNAKVSLSFTRITAPMDGRTGAITAKVGAMVRAADSAPLVTLTQLRPINVAFNVAERHLPTIRQAMRSGAKLTVTAAVPGDARPPADGALTFVDSQVDQQSGTILVKGQFPNADTRLWPGQFVDVVLTLRVEPNALTLPSESVQTGQDGRFVYAVKDDDTVEIRPVTVERSQDGLAVIASGLKAGERVVVEGQSRLYPGAKVTAARGGPPAGDGKPQAAKGAGAKKTEADAAPATGGGAT